MSERVKAFSVLAIMIIFLGAVLAITFGVINADELTKAVTAVLAIASAIYAWWKNNNVTENAIEAQKILDQLNAGEKEEKTEE